MVDILSRRLFYNAFLYHIRRKRSKIIVEVNSQRNLFVLRTEKSIAFLDTSIIAVHVNTFFSR